MPKKKKNKSVRSFFRKIVTLLKQFLSFLYGNFGLIYGKWLLHQGKDKEAMIRWVRTERRIINKKRLQNQISSYISDNEEWEKCLNYIDIGMHGKSNINNPRIKSFQKWLEYNKIANIKPKVKTFKDIALMYSEKQNYQSSDIVLENGIKLWKNNKTLRNEYAINAIHLKNWVVAIKRFTFNKTLYKNQKVPMTLLVRLSMLYQIIGFTSKARFEDINNNYSREIEEDSKGYRKITLFDNGDSRIEFYKKLKPVSKVVITFDSINMIWSNPPFGYKLLKKQDVDIIAVRKRKKQTYMQDLSQEDFVATVSSLLNNYEDRMAYGYSLGGYAAVYYASNLNCRILSISPRLSIHPRYGKKNVRGKHKFVHNQYNTYNDKISPIIIYDSKNALDNTYVHDELLEAFPNASLIDVNYGGHGMAPHLLKMGLLKDFVLTFIEGESSITYDRKRRLKSSIYYRVLGQACLKRNKHKWALDLAQKSLDLSSTDHLTVKLKYKALKKLDRSDEAISFLKDTLIQMPKNIDVWLLLIDHYIEIGKYFEAENAIKKAEKIMKKKVQRFSGRKQLIQR